MALSAPSSAHPCGEAQSGLHAVTVTVAPSRRIPISGLSASGRSRTLAKCVFTAAENGGIRASELVLGRDLSSLADAAQTKTGLKTEPQTATLAISEKAINTPRFPVAGLSPRIDGPIRRPSFSSSVMSVGSGLPRLGL